MNWFTNFFKKAFNNDRKLIVTGKKMYMGKYLKITFKVDPEVPPSIISYLSKDIRDDISKRASAGEKWLFGLMTSMKQKYGHGDITWIMFSRFKDGTYWVDPYYAEKVANKFLDLGYDSTKLGALADKGVKEGSLVLDGTINSESIVIQVMGYLPGFLKEKIKQMEFRGEKVGNNFFWNKKTKTIEEQINALSTLFFIKEFNSDKLKNKAISYYSNLFNSASPIDLLRIKSKIRNINGFGKEDIVPIIDNLLNIDMNTGEIQ